jgi:GH25 family lysozyme M1 (1,4-beta-N-acetylmuramidase)
MFFDLKALTAALLLVTAAFGAAVEFPGNLQKRAQPKGIDVSAYQPNVDWTAVHSSGVTFAYIKATEGTSEHNGALIIATR